MSTLNKRYKGIINALAEMVYLFDRDGACLDFINPPNHQTLVSTDIILSKNLVDIFPQPLANEMMDYIGITLNTGEINRHYYQLLMNDEIRSYETRYVPSGKNNVLALVRDITETKRIEADLVRSREELRQLTNHIEKIREEERLNISREIHDELGQQLAVFKITISRVGKKITDIEDSLDPDIKEMLDTIDKMVDTVRRISAELRPRILEDLGLVAALDWYSNNFSEKTSIKTSFTSDIQDDKIPMELGLCIFRILQESLTNVVRHSEATKLDISLMFQERDLVLLIEDNGKGFDVSTENFKTPGLLGMKERATMMKGTYTIYSNPGEGTVIAVIIPFLE